MTQKTIKTIGIIFNLKPPVSDDSFEEYDEIDTIYALRNEIEKIGFSVALIEQDDDFLKNILSVNVDFVLNIAEGQGRTRARESQVPCILESIGIPYSGSDPVALGNTLDKHLTSIILRSAAIPVPVMFMVKALKETESMHNIFDKKRAYIVKPRWEGSSKGIFSHSVVTNFNDLKKRVKEALVTYQQPAVVEQFLDGDEITVGVCGNKSPRVLGMMKITHQEPSQEPFIYGIENKREWQTKIKYEPQKAIGNITKTRIKTYALDAFRVLELNDVSRIDFRVDKNGVPRIIDINPLPGLSPRYSDLPILYRLNGGSYHDLIKTILKESFKRHGFQWPRSSV
jgi:D-alanine-D-alanine ligase